MTIKTGNSKSWLYDFRGGLQFLLQSVDVNDTALISRRAVELHAFQFSLYYPYLTQLALVKDRPPPKTDTVALTRKYAALQLYNYYASRAVHKNALAIKRAPSLNNIQKGLARNFKPIEVLLEILKEYVAVESPSVLEKDVSQDEFVTQFGQQVHKSKAIARLVRAYMTNGDELPNTRGRPVGSKIMRQALLRAGVVEISEKTLLKYFNELALTAVFHYLIRRHHCGVVLDQLNHYSRVFPQQIIQRARKADNLRDVRRIMYNPAASELNEKYGFEFPVMENVPESETETKYDALIDDERDPKLTKTIRDATGRTE